MRPNNDVRTGGPTGPGGPGSPGGPGGPGTGARVGGTGCESAEPDVKLTGTSRSDGHVTYVCDDDVAFISSRKRNTHSIYLMTSL